MKIRTGVMLVVAAALLATPPLVVAATPAKAATAKASSHKGPYTDAELDQMLAPIALYPDELLTQVLMASTYPLEVVEAARWVRKPDNAALSGEELTRALNSEPWAPSVKSLVPFPQVLRMMDDNLTWTEQLGDAFLSDQKKVMNSVQRLRRQAKDSGHLNSSKYADVKSEGSQIVIVSAVPNYVYVPVYDPFYVYGPWLYPAYPPYYFTGYFNVTLTNGWGWFGFSVVPALWGWSNWYWPGGYMTINPRRYNEMNRFGPRFRGDRWRHDPYHRHGVPYPSAELRERFHTPGGRGELRRYRGYPIAPAPMSPANVAPQVFGRGAAGAAGATRQRQFQNQRREAERLRQREQPRGGQQQFRQREQPRFRAPQSGTRRFEFPRSRNTSPAFESFGRSGWDIRSQSQRGFSSRRSAPGGNFIRRRMGGGGGGFGGDFRGRGRR